MTRRTASAYRRAPRRQNGFTLIEILVTLGVTTFALLGLLSTIRVTQRAGADSARANEAVALAEGMAEQLRGITITQFENIDWAHQSDPRLSNEAASNCDHTGKPYGSMAIGTTNGAEQSWVSNGVGGGCDESTWQEWHEGPVRGATGVEFRRGIRYTKLDYDLVWMQVIVEWTNEGARAGFDNGRFDRSVTVELLRSVSEVPR
jgi:prepilin-type N-terminal cleavage/methylation domain-containing protein